MSYQDPGDDEREAMRMRKQPWTWQQIAAPCIAVGGPLAILVAALIWSSMQ